MKARVTQPLSADNVNMVLYANLKGLMRTSEIVPVQATATKLILNIPHDLGEIPDDFQYSRMDNLSIGMYATLAQRKMWTATSCEVSASAAGEFRVWFVKRIV